MTETNAAGTDHGLAGTAGADAARGPGGDGRRTRLAAGPAAAVIVVSLFLSLSWLGVFRIMPDMARLAAMVAAWRSPRWPRSIRCASSASRRRARSTAASSAPTSSPTRRCWCRPTGRAARRRPGRRLRRALWREHQRRMADSLGGVGGDLPRTRVPERDPWGLRAAAALLLVVGLRLLLRAVRRQPRRRFPGAWRAGDHPAAHRRLGDAAAPIPARRRSS